MNKNTQTINHGEKKFIFSELEKFTDSTHIKLGSNVLVITKDFKLIEESLLESLFNKLIKQRVFGISLLGKNASKTEDFADYLIVKESVENNDESILGILTASEDEDENRDEDEHNDFITCFFLSLARNSEYNYIFSYGEDIKKTMTIIEEYLKEYNLFNK